MPVGKNYKVGTAPLTQPPGTGLGTVDQRMLILADIEQLLTSEDMQLVDSSDT